MWIHEDTAQPRTAVYADGLNKLYASHIIYSCALRSTWHRCAQQETIYHPLMGSVVSSPSICIGCFPARNDNHHFVGWTLTLLLIQLNFPLPGLPTSITAPESGHPSPAWTYLMLASTMLCCICWLTQPCLLHCTGVPFRAGTINSFSIGTVSGKQ